VLQAYIDRSGNTLRIYGCILDKLDLLGSNNQGLGSSHVINTMMDRDGHFSRENIQIVSRRIIGWLAECMAIASTMGSGEEPFRDTLLYVGDMLKEIP